MFVEPDGALRAETTGPTPSAATLAAALPRSLDYVEGIEEVETGDDVLDEYLYSGIIQVAINDQRWAAFRLSGAEADEAVWLPCNPEELQFSRAVPDGTTIALAAGIEWGSMTSGTFSWSLVDIGSGLVCFVADPDEDPTTCQLEPRRDRTNLELARAFADWVDWEPVSLAVTRAIETGGEFDGVAADFDEEWSDSCEVTASIMLPLT